MNLLITTVGGLTSPDIIKALKTCGRFSAVFGVDPFEDAVGKFFVDEFEVSPYSGSDEDIFLNFVKDVVSRWEIDVIVPCGNEDVLALSSVVGDWNVKIVSCRRNILEVAFDKGCVYDLAKEFALDLCPRYFIVKNKDDFIKAAESLGYPEKEICVKPRCGRGGRGVVFLSDSIDFEGFFSTKPELKWSMDSFLKILPEEFPSEIILMEKLRSPFYSFYAICWQGEILLSLTHIRQWGNASQTFRGKVFWDGELQERISVLMEKLQLSFCVNVELAVGEDKKLKIFDLNPRIAASSAVDVRFGINFPDMAVQLCLRGDEAKEEIEGMRDKIKKVEDRFFRYFDLLWEKERGNG